MAGYQGQSGADQGGHEVAARAIFPHVFKRLIEERVVGQEQLRAPLTGFGDEVQGGLQGHQDGLDLLVGVSHFEPHPVAGDGPGRWIAAFQQVNDVSQPRAH